MYEAANVEFWKAMTEVRRPALKWEHRPGVTTPP
jgi:hypothetical protein